MKRHIEHDSLGPVAIADGRLWGPQTQRSLDNFRIGCRTMPIGIIRALAIIKQACALANADAGRLSRAKCDAIGSACEAIIAGRLDGQFPLSVYQTGSGTQTNMNINEVIVHHAADRGVRLHPNDDVNMSQSTNDVFPTAIHVAAALAINGRLAGALDEVDATLAQLARRYRGQMKIARTHLQDATPMTFGQEVEGWRGLLQTDRRLLKALNGELARLPLGGTAVGTGVNAPVHFDRAAVAYISKLTGMRFSCLANKFSGLSSRNVMVALAGGLDAMASDLIKIANDVRWLASGPDAGLGEITIPANEPGSSIMPGKINPTQAEALVMAAIQVMGDMQAVAIANSQGNFQLNVTMPLITADILSDIDLLADAMTSFDVHLLKGLRANAAVMDRNVSRSLMNAAVLTPHIGYDKAAAIVARARSEGTTLRQAAIASGWLTGAQFDAIYDLKGMLHGG